jgi:hypothetical protein
MIPWEEVVPCSWSLGRPSRSPNELRGGSLLVTSLATGRALKKLSPRQSQVAAVRLAIPEAEAMLDPREPLSRYRTELEAPLMTE